MLKILIWGTGVYAQKYVLGYHKQMQYFSEIQCFIDNDEKKQESSFYGYRVISYNQSIQYEYDYIVIMNSYEKEIRQQILKNTGSDEKVLSHNDYFRLFIETGYWNNTRVLFMGDRMNYDLVKYRALHTFLEINYSEDIDGIEKYNFDVIFICPPRLLSKEATESYERSIRKKIYYAAHIRREAVFGVEEWMNYFLCDRRIKGENINSDSAFLIIGALDPTLGFGNIIKIVLSSITYAKKHDMIPVVDMQNTESQYLKEELLGKHNAWEDFFESVSEYKLEDAYCSKNIILTGIYGHMECDMNYKDIALKAHVKNHIDNIYTSLFPKSSKVLGVIYRGTDYNVAAGHTLPMAIDAYIKYIERYLKKIGYEYIFLATEVEEAAVEFKNYFADKVFFTNQKRYSKNERRWLYSVQFERENDTYLRGIEYLTVLELLSSCDSLIGSNTGGLRAAIVMNDNNYEHVEIIPPTT
ncbi:hypothetical protein SAMN05443270_2228 [Lacrimispora sphenoides]|jgi:hypothetical protein|uniref:hypothetical protein n=1 Tax=Lacrimispora sphenoides TaxID=29370 RepID=UPI0008B4017F|nr:hypothetical protein [Lacrimispora sphenoides]SET95007.1 hypothetical protein SAMN05443270_2228 [Lacrimispora sphenoides]